MFFVPHEQLSNFCDFLVRPMSDVFNDFNLQDYKSSDHSILLWSKRTHEVKSPPEISDAVKTCPLNEKKLLFDNIRASFLNCENSFQMISDCIDRTETYLECDKNVTEAYTCFIELIHSEMQNKLKCIIPGRGKIISYECRSKPFWNTEVQGTWNNVYAAEKQWLKFKGSTVTKKRLRQEYCLVPNNFDKMLRKAKRTYQLAEQQSLRDKLHNIENPRDNYEEVRKSVYEAKLRKASGIDNIPAEVLRNETCIDLLFKIISYAFANGRVPNEWSKGIIKPLPKSDDLRNPLNYRPITIISILCKIYANILNRRLLLWLENNGLLADEQNGFRKDRSCQDHIYALYSLIHNRRLHKIEFIFV